MASDGCGSFTLDHLGEKGMLSATETIERCWNR
jgi:hypothetical protein